MKLHSFYFLTLGLFIAITSCAQNSDSKKTLFVKDGEILLVLTRDGQDIITAGEHKVEKDSKIITFAETDSVILEEFDILDSNAQTLFCRPRIKYTLTPYHIQNISDKLQWIHTIKTYKNRLLEPEIRAAVRNVAFHYLAELLIREDFIEESNLKSIMAKRLEKYIKLEAIEMNIYKK